MPHPPGYGRVDGQAEGDSMSDGPQALLPHQFLDLMGDLRRLAAALDREFWAPEQN